MVDTFLGSLVQSRCREGGTLQTNNTVVWSHCLSHTGPVPTHGAYALAAHTAQALGCSAGNRPRPALVCIHRPGPSHSGQALRYSSEVHTQLGLRFVPFPSLSSSGDEVFGKHSRCNLLPPPCLLFGFLGAQPAHLLRQMLTVQNPKKP